MTIIEYFQIMDDLADYKKKLIEAFPFVDPIDLLDKWEEFSEERYYAGFIFFTIDHLKEFKQWCLDYDFSSYEKVD